MSEHGRPSEKGRTRPKRRRELVPFEPKRKVVRYLASLKSTPKNFRWVETGKIASSAVPVRQRQLNWLVEKNRIKSVLSLTETDLRSQGFDTSKIEHYKHVPMVDHAVPTNDQVSAAVAFLESKTIDKSSSPVLVHCLGGMGRTGVVLASFLAKRNGWSADEAVSKLRSMWPEYVETKQEIAVADYVRSLESKDKS